MTMFKTPLAPHRHPGPVQVMLPTDQNVIHKFLGVTVENFLKLTTLTSVDIQLSHLDLLGNNFPFISPGIALLLLPHPQLLHELEQVRVGNLAEDVIEFWGNLVLDLSVAHKDESEDSEGQPHLGALLLAPDTITCG